MDSGHAESERNTHDDADTDLYRDALQAGEQVFPEEVVLGTVHDTGRSPPGRVARVGLDEGVPHGHRARQDRWADPSERGDSPPQEQSAEKRGDMQTAVLEEQRQLSALGTRSRILLLCCLELHAGSAGVC